MMCLYMQNYSSKMRDLKAREEALQAREEKLREREERVASREKSVQAREQQLSEDIAKRAPLPTHCWGPAVRPRDDTNGIGKESTASDDYRRMSLGGVNDDETRPLSVDVRDNSTRDGSGTAAPFPIYCDVKEDKSGTTAQPWRRDDFTTGVARARELLGRPRLMTKVSSTAPDSKEKVSDKETHSNFYKNYLNSRKTDQLSENIQPTRLPQDGRGSRPETSKVMRQPPAPPPHIRRRSVQGNALSDITDCGSATKRPRHDENASEVAPVSGDVETYRKAEIVPSVHIDLHTLLANGTGNQEYL